MCERRRPTARRLTGRRGRRVGADGADGRAERWEPRRRRGAYGLVWSSSGRGRRLASAPGVGIVVVKGTARRAEVDGRDASQ
jgi:hypothetical protein